MARNLRTDVITALAIFTLLVLLTAGCSSPVRPVKRSFVGDSADNPGASINPKGLNPLGKIESCEQGSQEKADLFRVLVSPPQYFSREASIMILALRNSLFGEREESDRVNMVMAPSPLENASQAQREGRRCGALIVLWEQRASNSLELTLPNPSRIPLKALAERKLCEFGNHSEQLTILYLTIRGLAALEKNQYDKANYFLRAANAIDDRCLFLPLPRKAVLHQPTLQRKGNSHG